MDYVSHDILFEITSLLSLFDILKYSLTNKEHYTNIWCNDNFWKRKYIFDFGLNPNNLNNQTWKQLYFESGNVQFIDNKFPSFKFNAKQISIGTHILLTDFQNNLWGYGDNKFYALGSGYFNEEHQIPTQLLRNDEPIKALQICASNNYSYIIDMNNNVWSCGMNDHLMLGVGSDFNGVRKEFTQIFMEINKPLQGLQISSRYDHTLFIDLDNYLWVWGFNSVGQIGLPDIEEGISYPQKHLFKVQQISAGNVFSLFIDMENNVWSCGYNKSGQLGLNHTNNSEVFTPILTSNGNPFKVKQISAGYTHALFIDLEDCVWVCGSNFNGECGLGNTNNQTIPVKIFQNNKEPFKAKQICAGEENSMFIDFENNVWVFGNIETKSTIPRKLPNIKSVKLSSGDLINAILRY